MTIETTEKNRFSENESENGRAVGKGIKVLIVDETLIVRRNAREILENNGYEVVGEADDGHRAVSMARELCPDMVLMDVYMDQMDGISAKRLIRADNPKARVVIMSQAAKPSIVTSSIRAGAANFIIKPFEEDQLLRTLKRYHR